MVRFLVVSVLVALLLGCASSHREPEPVRQYGWVNVGVTENTVDVRVRPGHDGGNVDVHVDWP